MGALSDADVGEIRSSLDTFTRCLKSKDFAKWVRYWAEDGILMPPDHPRVVGREAILDYIRKNYGNVQSMTLSDWKVFGANGLAVVSTNVEWTNQADPQPSGPSKQVVVASKDDAGTWQWKMIIFNAGV